LARKSGKPREPLSLLSDLTGVRDFSTNEVDRPLIVQFGANSALELARAAELVRPYCSGVDINCVCPQACACHEGLGAHLMHEKELVAEMVKAVKARCGQDFCVSVKIRIHADLRKTVDFVKVVEAAGIDFISCHGRRRGQKSSEPVNLNAIKLVNDTVRVPVLSNGDVFNLADVRRIADYTGVAGVMSARGLLENPALFSGFERTPVRAVEKFVGHVASYPIPYKLVQHHLSEMTAKFLSKKQRAEMMGMSDMLHLVDWISNMGYVASPEHACA